MTVYLLMRYTAPYSYSGEQVVGVFASYESAERALWRAQDDDERPGKQCMTDPHDFSIADWEVK